MNPLLASYLARIDRLIDGSPEIDLDTCLAKLQAVLVLQDDELSPASSEKPDEMSQS